MDTLKVMAAKRPVMTYEAHLTLSSMGYGIRFRRLNNYIKSKSDVIQAWLLSSMGYGNHPHVAWQLATSTRISVVFLEGTFFNDKWSYNNLKSLLLFSHQSSRHFFPLSWPPRVRPGAQAWLPTGPPFFPSFFFFFLSSYFFQFYCFLSDNFFQ